MSKEETYKILTKVDEYLEEAKKTGEYIIKNINKIHEKDCLWTTKIKAQEIEEKKGLDNKSKSSFRTM